MPPEPTSLTGVPHARSAPLPTAVRLAGAAQMLGKSPTASCAKRDRSVIPVTPTWLQLTRVPRWSGSWRHWFPFRAHAGQWTFSGRVALYHGLPSLKLPPHSTVLVPAYHQGIEIDTLLAAGHRVRYYRVSEQLVMDLADVERRLDGTVSALYVTHYFGFPQALEPIRRFCDAHRLQLIEDCALALFSRDRGTWLGSVGDLSLFSVYKTLPLPHGGFLVTKGDQAMGALPPAPLASTGIQIADLVHHSLQGSGWGWLDRWARQASHGVAQMVRWDRSQTISSGAPWDARLLAYGASPWTVRLMQFMDPSTVVARRRANYARLAGLLHDHVTCPFPDLPEGVCPLFLPILVPHKMRFKQRLEGLGVESGNWWDDTHPTCPPVLADEVASWRRHCLELPIHQELSDAHIDRVAIAALNVLGQED